MDTVILYIERINLHICIEKDVWSALDKLTYKFTHSYEQIFDPLTKKYGEINKDKEEFNESCLDDDIYLDTDNTFEIYMNVNGSLIEKTIVERYGLLKTDFRDSYDVPSEKVSSIQRITSTLEALKILKYLENHVYSGKYFEYFRTSVYYQCAKYFDNDNDIQLYQDILCIMKARIIENNHMPQYVNSQTEYTTNILLEYYYEKIIYLEDRLEKVESSINSEKDKLIDDAFAPKDGWIIKNLPVVIGKYVDGKSIELCPDDYEKLTKEGKKIGYYSSL